MTVLVLGPNGSGKSVWAERLAVRLSSGALYYVATMIPDGEAGLAKVAKHRKQRLDMGFITVEQPSGISGLALPPDAVVLLEDVSNLLANALFADKRTKNADHVFREIEDLCAHCRAAVLVSIDGLRAEPEFSPETRGYIDELNRLNSRLADFSDTVLTMRDGEAVCVKGNALAPG